MIKKAPIHPKGKDKSIEKRAKAITSKAQERKYKWPHGETLNFTHSHRNTNKAIISYSIFLGIGKN